MPTNDASMRSSFRNRWLLCAACAWCAVWCASCRPSAVPKPQGYFRISLPDSAYRRYERPGRPYAFDYSELALVTPDRARGADPLWINITYPGLGCKIHITYLRLTPRSERQAFEDSHRLVYKHTIKAEAIEETYYDDPSRRVHATFYDIRGNAATPAQFAITDSLGQFFRGSLYFSCRPNKDSLAPVIEYVDRDIVRLIESFEWRGE